MAGRRGITSKNSKPRLTITFFRLYPGLMKIPLNLMISLSAVFGVVLKENVSNTVMFLTGSGIFLLASGGAALNNYQDRHIDRHLSRTRNRPLASGNLAPQQALIFSATLIFIGLAILYFIHLNFFLPMLGVIALIIYNGIYTPLKSRTVLAVVPGAFCGMMPPLIGWMAAGGELFSIKIWMVMVMFGLWQLPHVWLILLNHCADYSRSAIPNMLQQFTRKQLERIVFIWILNFSVMLLLFPVFYIKNKSLLGWIIIFTAASLILVTFVNFFIRSTSRIYVQLFNYLNGTVFFVMIVVIVDRMIGI
jgi:protoheme IX farnesyltransferase